MQLFTVWSDTWQMHTLTDVMIFTEDTASHFPSPGDMWHDTPCSCTWSVMSAFVSRWEKSTVSVIHNPITSMSTNECTWQVLFSWFTVINFGPPLNESFCLYKGSTELVTITLYSITKTSVFTYKTRKLVEMCLSFWKVTTENLSGYRSQKYA